MTRYIKNVNAYLAQMKIKQTYVSLKSGIDKNKLSRILTGVQKIDGEDMEKIANALGHRVEYFLADDFSVPCPGDNASAGVAFYAGQPTKEQQEFAMKLIDLIENVDEVLSAEKRFMDAFTE